MREQLKWHDEKADNSPWLNALASLRQRAAREGHCFTSRQSSLRSINMQRRRWQPRLLSQQALRRRLAVHRPHGLWLRVYDMKLGLRFLFVGSTRFCRFIPAK